MMKRMPREEAEEKLQGYATDIRRMEIPTHASHACYFLMLSVFPALVLILGLLQYTRLDDWDLMELVQGYIPDALEPYLWRMISGAYQHTTKGVLSLSAVGVVWSAGRGLYGLLSGLNAVYGIEDRRSWLVTRLVCAGYTVLFLVVLILTLVLHVFGNSILQMLMPEGGLAMVWMDLVDLRFFVLVALQTLLFCAMFMYLPGRHNGFRESLPGALFASLGWMVFSALFSIYVEHFPKYTVIYGSVYAAALGMLWLYMCVSIVFYGAVLNRMLGKWKKS